MHVAIIMNGNGRWAARRGLPARAGYVEGVAALRTTVELALSAGVKTLTLYALGSSTCPNPGGELEADLRVLTGYLCAEAAREQPIRISVIGKGDQLGASLSRLRAYSTRLGSIEPPLHLRIVIDYSEHDHLVRSSWRSGHPHTPETFAQRIRELDDTALPAGAVDLLIRTGDGKCQSDFMLWEVAYARLHHAGCLWPDFNAEHFERALRAYTAHRGRTARVASAPV
jgi:undecaprenyl diphosphate synthase